MWKRKSILKAFVAIGILSLSLIVWTTINYNVKWRRHTHAFVPISSTHLWKDTPTTRNDQREDINVNWTPNVTEVSHVAFLKVHKCGSSTVQNIFLRFGYYRNLTFILGHEDKDKAETSFQHVISFTRSLYDDNVVPPPHGRHFDILCCHVIYNRKQFRKFLPKDTVYIGIVREPIKRLESSIEYFHLLKMVDMSAFASDPLRYQERFPSMCNNRMAFEFGFPRRYFPSMSSNISTHSIEKRISKYLKTLQKDFRFIIINEYMDESLVYLKRLLRWQIKDILYSKLLTSKVIHRTFNEDDARKLVDFLYLDYAIYNFAVKLFDEAVAKEKDDFQIEVEHFKETNERVRIYCSSKSEDNLSVEASRWNERFIVTPDECELFTLRERRFVKRVRRQQYGTETDL